MSKKLSNKARPRPPLKRLFKETTLKKKPKADRVTGRSSSNPVRAPTLEYLSPEEIAQCNGAPLLLSQEERRQQIATLTFRQVTHGASQATREVYSLGEAQAFPNRVNKRPDPQ